MHLLSRHWIPDRLFKVALIGRALVTCLQHFMLKLVTISNSCRHLVTVLHVCSRRRLAPIRGIPTKGGKMVSPNADLEDIFSTIENIPNAPKKLFAGIRSWARGDKDPTWKR